jgi:hypothetical protein
MNTLWYLHPLVALYLVYLVVLIIAYLLKGADADSGWAATWKGTRTRARSYAVSKNTTNSAAQAGPGANNRYLEEQA